MERRKLGWIKIVKKDRRILDGRRRKHGQTGGPRYYIEARKRGGGCRCGKLCIISSRFTPVFIEPFDELTTMLDFIRFHKRNLIVWHLVKSCTEATRYIYTIGYIESCETEIHWRNVLVKLEIIIIAILGYKIRNIHYIALWSTCVTPSFYVNPPFEYLIWTSSSAF